MSQSSENAPSENYIFTKEYFRELAEQKAIALRHQTDHLTQSLSATFSQLGGRINKVTGYDEIDALKKGVVEQGTLRYISYSHVRPFFLLSHFWNRCVYIHRGSNYGRAHCGTGG